jgi:hypothetical protein
MAETPKKKAGKSSSKAKKAAIKEARTMKQAKKSEAKRPTPETE